MADAHFNVLVIGAFFSWRNGTPQLLLRWITFDRRQPNPVILTPEVRTITETESALNRITLSLIGDSGEALKWEGQKRSITPDQLAWKRLESLVFETSLSDPTVSADSDVLEIPLEGIQSGLRVSLTS